MEGSSTRPVASWAHSRAGPGLSQSNVTAVSGSPGPLAAPFIRQARALCPGINNQQYWCETGHCCGETGCCTYFYELWWFWLLWTLLIIFSCCCAYRHRRSKLRIQQQQRQQEINLIAYHGACHYPGSGLDQRLLASFKLPAYEEVSAQPRTPPPSYTSIQCPGVRTELSSSLSSNNITSSHHTPIAHSTDFEPGPPVPSSHQSTEDVNIAVSQASPCCLGLEEDEEEDEDETHSRHRRLTGDSGIEVCHCLVHADGSEDCEESSNYQHDQMVSVELHTAPLQPANYASPCSCLLPQETSTHILPV
ncbi:WW domain-binding protein 1-like isoform X1 [Hemiscyllium ocellatum]|uniref:WW domain-binding protein 1-like isoform X1 n=1 Tax=Hemiscyllium ocellatum TaxID=170820 RepID=UPI00296771D3|nr:WW domain-binding protein 1-like isoform X1 [Hemiscyllium ocellatum]